MTTVFFVRHGPTEENKIHRIQGQQPGTLLVPETERYLSAITPLLREKAPQLLLSSDLDRAVQTREILQEFLQIPDVKYGVSPLLREKAMGFYEGMLWSEVPAEFQEQRKKTDYDFRKFGGENEEDVRVRVKEALRRFSQRYPNMRIACITHAGWLRQLVQFADHEGVLPDGWTKRTAIYEGGLGPIGQLQYFHPIKIEAKLSAEEEE
jgi:2,3-bisphosphoglycerate-dependent phosphoglycerate mutase